MEVIQHDQGVRRMLSARREKTPCAVAGNGLDGLAFLFSKALVEGIKDALSMLVVVPDYDPFFNVH